MKPLRHVIPAQKAIKLKNIGLTCLLLLSLILIIPGTELTAVEPASADNWKPVPRDSSAPPAVTWTRTFGSDQNESGYQVRQSRDGGFIITGKKDSWDGGQSDAWLIKTNELGIESWNRLYGGEKNDSGETIALCTDGGFIVTGYTRSYGAGQTDVWLFKVSSSGEQEWSRTFGGSDRDEGFAVQQTSDGGYVIVGYTKSFRSGDRDVWLIKTNGTGVEEWNRTFGGAGRDLAVDVKELPGEGYIIAADTDSYGAGSRDIWLVRTDLTGTELWNRTFGGLKEDYPYSIQVTTDGSYIIGGVSHSYGSGISDAWLLKITSMGNEFWNQTYGGQSYDVCYEAWQTSDGGYIMAGSTVSFGNFNDLWLIKYTTDGEYKWRRIEGGDGHDYAFGGQQTADGGFITVGRTDSYGAGKRDVYLVKIEPDRTYAHIDDIPDIEWSRQYGGYGSESCNSIEPTADGGFIAAGTYFQVKTYTPVSLLKIDGDGNEQWFRRYEELWEGYGHHAVQTTDGGYIVTGWTYVLDSYNNKNLILIKTDADGNIVWNRSYGGSSEDIGMHIQPTSDGGYIVAGYTASFGNGLFDIWVLKLDYDGIEQWNRTYGNEFNNKGWAVKPTIDGGYIITGFTTLSQYGYKSVWLMKTDANGTEEWGTSFIGDRDDDEGRSVHQTLDGGYVVLASMGHRSYSNDDIWLIKTDGNGTMQWEKIFGGSDYDAPGSVLQTADGGYIIVGHTSSYGQGFSDIWVIKTDGFGNLQWDRLYSGSEREEGKAVVQVSNDSYVIAGNTESYGEGYQDIIIFKISGNITDEVDNNPPVCVLSSHNGYAQVSGTVTFYGTASDIESNISFVEYRINSFYEKGESNWTRANGTTGWQFSWDTLNLSREGSYELFIRAYDGKFYSENVFLGLNVNNGPPPNDNEPVCTITWPPSMQTVSGTVRIEGLVSDLDLDGVKEIRLKIDGMPPVYYPDVNDSWLFYWDSTTVYDGKHMISVSAYDGRYYSDDEDCIVAVYVENGLIEPEEEEDEYNDRPYSFAALMIILIIISVVLVIVARVYTPPRHRVPRKDEGGEKRDESATSGKDEGGKKKEDSVDTNKEEKREKKEEKSMKDDLNKEEKRKRKKEGGKGFIIIALITVFILSTSGMVFLGSDSADASTIPEKDRLGFEWWNIFSGSWSYPREVIEMDDGGYVFMTQKYGKQKGDIWLIKLDKDGNFEWEKFFGGPVNDRGISMIKTADGGYAILGVTDSYGIGEDDIWLIKTDSAFNEQWNRTYGSINNDNAYSLISDQSGGYIILCNLRLNKLNSDVNVIKTDASGKELFNRSYGGKKSDYGMEIEPTPDSGYIICAKTDSYGEGEGNIWLIKLTSNFDEQWNVTVEYQYYTYISDFQRTSDGGYIISATTTTVNSYSYSDSALLIKTDSAGAVEWQETYDVGEYIEAESVLQTQDGGYALTGSASTIEGDSDIFLVKANSKGKQEWLKYIGTIQDDEAHLIKQVNDGGYIILGEIGLDDIIIKIDSNFGGSSAKNVICSISHPTPEQVVKRRVSISGRAAVLYSEIIRVEVRIDSGDWQVIGDRPYSWTYSWDTSEVKNGKHTISARAYNGEQYSDVVSVEVTVDNDKPIAPEKSEPIWQQVYGKDEYLTGYSVQQTIDGGFIIVGNSENFFPGIGDEFDVHLLKTDKNGKEEWSKSYGELSNEIGESVQQTNDGGYIIAGWRNTDTDNEIEAYLLKTNSKGDLLWDRTFGGFHNDKAYSVQQTGDGGFIVTGSTLSFGSGRNDVWLIKTDSTGREEWNKTYGGEEDDYGYSVLQTRDGGFIVAGKTESYQSRYDDPDVYIIKTDDLGGVQWIRVYGGSDDDNGEAVLQTLDGGYAVVGKTTTTEPTTGTRFVDAWLIKLNGEGREQWNMTYGGNSADFIVDIVEAHDGGYLMAGTTNSFSGKDSAALWLVKTNTFGKMQWSKTFSEEGTRSAWDLELTSDGGYVVLGQTKDDFILIKVDNKGSGGETDSGMILSQISIAIAVIIFIVILLFLYTKRRKERSGNDN